jgi:hypothetical protein
VMSSHSPTSSFVLVHAHVVADVSTGPTGQCVGFGLVMVEFESNITESVKIIKIHIAYQNVHKNNLYLYKI